MRHTCTQDTSGSIDVHFLFKFLIDSSISSAHIPPHTHTTCQRLNDDVLNTFRLVFPSFSILPTMAEYFLNEESLSSAGFSDF